jgi:hypothetical protein
MTVQNTFAHIKHVIIIYCKCYTCERSEFKIYWTYKIMNFIFTKPSVKSSQINKYETLQGYNMLALPSWYSSLTIKYNLIVITIILFLYIAHAPKSQNYLR